MFEYDLLERARADRRHIVLPEGADERILRAAEILLRRRVADLTLLGDETRSAARRPARPRHRRRRRSSTRPTRSCASASPQEYAAGARTRG